MLSSVWTLGYLCLSPMVNLNSGWTRVEAYHGEMSTNSQGATQQTSIHRAEGSFVCSTSMLHLHCALWVLKAALGESEYVYNVNVISLSITVLKKILLFQLTYRCITIVITTATHYLTLFFGVRDINKTNQYDSSSK